MAWPYTFASLSGSVSAATLDANFAAAAFAVDVTALTAVVAALPSATLPAAPVAGGVIGVATTLARADHQHPPQPATVNLQMGTSYTLQATDDGKVVELQNAAAIALTAPNTLPVNFSCLIVQTGAGQVTIAPASGATQRNAGGYTKTRTQWSVFSLYVRANAGAAAEYVLAGDMA